MPRRCGTPAPRGSSPRSRGAPVRGEVAARAGGIIPAFAGSTASRASARRCQRDHPRVRGKHGAAEQVTTCSRGSSPRSRGAPGHSVAKAVVGGIIPAFAGSTGFRAGRRLDSRDHPRVRGEHFSTKVFSRSASGSSPRSRGALRALPLREFACGIIPAFAGSTETMRASWAKPRDHPRVRGEHVMSPTSSVMTTGSSPRSRGAPCRIARVMLPGGIIPAFAGSTSPPCPGCAPGWDHPRVRGEHGGTDGALTEDEGSSPRSRGARRENLRNSRDDGIIPAFAGSTRRASQPQPSVRDHPRVRGEH